MFFLKILLHCHHCIQSRIRHHLRAPEDAEIYDFAQMNHLLNIQFLYIFSGCVFIRLLM